MLIPSKFSGYHRDGRRLYLGKSDTPSPDPRLVEAQIHSLGVQDEVIQSIMQQSKDLAPLQKEQMQFGLDSARTAYQQSQDDREWMLGRRDKLSGLQDKMVQDASTYSAEDRGNQLAAQAMGDVNPNDGRSAAMEGQMAAQQALGLATAGNKAREQARQEGYALTDRATNALAGYPAQATQATGAGAQYGGLGLSTANSALQGMNSGYGMAGQMAGSMGQNASSMYGQQANLYMQSQNADSSAFGGLGSAVGGIATAFAL